MQIPLWFRINKSEFDELTSDIYDNQNNKDFKITINKKTYDLKNAKKNWTKVTTSKTSKNEIEQLYKELIQKDIDALEREKSNSIKKDNTLNCLKNTLLFTKIQVICTKNYARKKVKEMRSSIFNQRNVK